MCVLRKWLKGIAAVKFALIVLLGLSVWSTRIPDIAYHPVLPEQSLANFHVIEFNDDGQMHLPAQFDALKARLRTTPGSDLLIFIHGWHHNAAPNDDNFVAFQRFYQQMSATNPTLLGLYIGWRGDQYDPFWLDGSDDPDSVVEPLDFPTIFTSKRVAKRVGEHGVRPLLAELDTLADEGILGRYTLIGHSLGGVVALHARKQSLLENLAKGQGERHLTVLLNPAASAREYQPLDKWRGPDNAGPAMLVLQSKTDFAVLEAFNWLKEGERAVGNSWAITHDIDPCPGRDCSRKLALPKALQDHDAKPGCMQVLDGPGWKIRARLHARKTVQSCEDANRQAVWVLAVADGVIAGHNGILTEVQGVALAAALDNWQSAWQGAAHTASISGPITPESPLWLEPHAAAEPQADSNHTGVPASK
ncbi:hydrolase [Shewanella zhangzhouensis]|uniref:hydrolase n=1 Tax=Shewanella zhangzhouensis TaxID=2864213 RepID=UPI001C65887E|nr:hydrolase [Shewanella zhangzhouensis]QYK07174.1 hydrolase [Shewanella zhangzhouensis]